MDNVYKIDYDKVFTNSEEFYAEALHFKEFKCYTKFPYSESPHSQYYKYWKEQTRRCMEGYDIGRDRITGYNYFYLNFSPIIIIKKMGDDVGDRVEDFPRFWDGDYMFYHLIEEAERAGRHFACIMTRGVGKSYKAASMLDRNYYLIPNSKSYAVASEKEYLIEDGILTKAFSMMDFIDVNTAFGKRRQYIDQPEHKRSSYKEDRGGIKVESGYKSEIMGVSVLNKPGRIRGKRGKLMIFEEGGMFPGLLECWNIALRSFGKGKITHGLMLALGTGGEEESDFDGLRELFYNPGGYKIYSMPNIWEDVENKTAYFHPAYLTLEGFVDKDGNSDIDGAKDFLLRERERVRKESDNPETLIRYIAEEPFTPQEAVMRTESTIFPVLWLKERLGELETDKKLRDAEEVGKFIVTDTGGIDFKYDDSLNPIYDYPLKDNKFMDGAIVMYERPYRDGSGKIPYLRYIAGCLIPGEFVITDKGLKEVSDIGYNDLLINQNGDHVLIDKLLRYYVKNEDVFTFSLFNTFRTTTFTKEHPVLVSKPVYKTNYKKYDLKYEFNEGYWNFDFKFVRAEDIDVGDWIKIPNIYKRKCYIDIDRLWYNEGYRIDRQIDNPIRNNDFAWFIGLWLGDGWCESNGYGISVSFNIKENNYINKFISLCYNLFKREVSLRIRNNCVQCSFSFQQLSKFLNNNFGKYAYGKYIPEWFKYMNNEFKHEFIKGYLNSDGCITKDKRGYYNICFVSISLELLESVQDILFSLGYISSLKKLRDEQIRFILKKRESKTKKCYQLALGHSDTVRLAKKIFSENDHKLIKIKFDNILNTRRKQRANCFFNDTEDFIYIRIKNIKKNKYTGIVYNFSCDSHTFMCHHITTHNCDPYEQDQSSSTSLGSLIIKDRFTTRIVLEYTGRPGMAEIFYENCRRALIFFNALCNYENNLIKGVFNYFDKMNSLIYLCDTPSNIRDKVIDTSSLSRGKGTPGTGPINSWGRGMINSWLKSPDLTNPESNKMNLYNIRCIPLLKELIDWKPRKGKTYDRISALGMCMIIEADLAKIEYKEVEEKEKGDDFWNRNYKRKNLFVWEK